jgi:hypothetical protein
MAVLFVAMLFSIMLVGHAEPAQHVHAPADSTPVAATHHVDAAQADGALGDSRLVTSDVLAQHLAHLDAADLVVTDDQREAATSLLLATRRGVARYASMQSAMSDDYVDIDGDVDGAIGASQVVYLYDRGFVRTGSWIDPGRPQGLVYLTGGGVSAPSLIGAVFVAPVGEGPRLGGGLTVWRPEADFCVDRDGDLAGRAVPTGCLTGASYLAWHPETLHLWLFDNPNGAFAGALTHEAVECARRGACAG